MYGHSENRHAEKRGMLRSQAAMEFLMTYGWSILIIAVVLGALFSMGVFSSANLAPRAPTGNCKVLRTSGTANLEGTCSGMLPQAVAQFNVANSNIKATTALTATTGWALGAWIYPAALPQNSLVVLDSNVGGTSGYGFGISNSGSASSELEAIWPSITWCDSGYAFGTTNKWYHVVMSDSGGTTKFYVNGVQTPDTCSITPSGISTNIWIGERVVSLYFNGFISDVQIYNTSLDASQVLALYQKGIGAAPIDPNHIVGWWPLNGDVNDYSGNNNNGAATAVTYTSSWLSGYTAP